MLLAGVAMMNDIVKVGNSILSAWTQHPVHLTQEIVSGLLLLLLSSGSFLPKQSDDLSSLLSCPCLFPLK